MLYIESEGKHPVENTVYGSHVLYKCFYKKQVCHFHMICDGPPERTVELERDSGTRDFNSNVSSGTPADKKLTCYYLYFSVCWKFVWRCDWAKEYVNICCCNSHNLTSSFICFSSVDSAQQFQKGTSWALELVCFSLVLSVKATQAALTILPFPYSEMFHLDGEECSGKGGEVP